MRMLCMIVAVLFMAAEYARSMESDMYNVNYYINPSRVPHSTLVSFSVGYPKGWMVFQNPGSLRRADIFNGIAIGLGSEDICSFAQPATNSLKPGFTSYTIWRSKGVTPKAAAEKFIADMDPDGPYTEKSLSPVKTNAGDSGWLVKSTGYLIIDPAIFKLMSDPAWLRSTNAVQRMIQIEKNLKPSQKAPIIYHEFFFHSQNKGAIRIEIMTEAANSSFRSDLDQLVLQTLRFNDN